MSQFINSIRDIVLPDEGLEERQMQIAALYAAKTALHVSAAALAILALSSNSLFCLASAYLSLEGAMIASNAQEVLENFSTEICVRLSRKLREKQLFQNAPRLSTFYQSFKLTTQCAIV